MVLIQVTSGIQVLRLIPDGYLCKAQIKLNRMNKIFSSHQAPCSFTILFNHFNINNMIRAVTRARTKFTQKKLALCSYPSHILANTPLILFPIDVDKNHPPIISAVNLGGLSFETRDNAIGLRHNSPIVITP